MATSISPHCATGATHVNLQSLLATPVLDTAILGTERKFRRSPQSQQSQPNSLPARYATNADPLFVADSAMHFIPLDSFPPETAPTTPAILPRAVGRPASRDSEKPPSFTKMERDVLHVLPSRETAEISDSEFATEFLTPLNNLLTSFEKSGDPERAEVVDNLKSAVAQHTQLTRALPAFAGVIVKDRSCPLTETTFLPAVVPLPSGSEDPARLIRADSLLHEARRTGKPFSPASEALLMNEFEQSSANYLLSRLWRNLEIVAQLWLNYVGSTELSQMRHNSPEKAHLAELNTSMPRIITNATLRHINYHHTGFAHYVLTLGRLNLCSVLFRPHISHLHWAAAVFFNRRDTGLAEFLRHLPRLERKRVCKVLRNNFRHAFNKAFMNALLAKSPRILITDFVSVILIDVIVTPNLLERVSHAAAHAAPLTSDSLQFPECFQMSPEDVRYKIISDGCSAAPAGLATAAFVLPSSLSALSAATEAMEALYAAAVKPLRLRREQDVYDFHKWKLSVASTRPDVLSPAMWTTMPPNDPLTIVLIILRKLGQLNLFSAEEVTCVAPGRSGCHFVKQVLRRGNGEDFQSFVVDTEPFVNFAVETVLKQRAEALCGAAETNQNKLRRTLERDTRDITAHQKYLKTLLEKHGSPELVLNVYDGFYFPDGYMSNFFMDVYEEAEFRFLPYGKYLRALPSRTRDGSIPGASVAGRRVLATGFLWNESGSEADRFEGPFLLFEKV